MLRLFEKKSNFPPNSLFSKEEGLPRFTRQSER